MSGDRAAPEWQPLWQMPGASRQAAKRANSFGQISERARQVKTGTQQNIFKTFQIDLA